MALDTFMSKTARLYQDTRTATAAANSSESNLDRLNGDLQDVTRIMTKNMEELLWRGDSLDSMLEPVFIAGMTANPSASQKCPISLHRSARNLKSIGKLHGTLICKPCYDSMHH